jgi:hypothetical protein
VNHPANQVEDLMDFVRIDACHKPSLDGWKSGLSQVFFENLADPWAHGTHREPP